MQYVIACTTFGRVLYNDFYVLNYNYEFDCRVHVVFGHVLSGQEIVFEIGNQTIGEDCRPLEDVIISNCGELIPQIKPKGLNIYKLNE